MDYLTNNRLFIQIIMAYLERNELYNIQFFSP